MACKPAQKIVKSMKIDEIMKQMRVDNAPPHYTEEELNDMGSKALRKFMKLSGLERGEDEPDSDGSK